jgi:hypothetical protein
MLKMLQPPTNWLLIRDILLTPSRLDYIRQALPRMAIFSCFLMSDFGIFPNAIPIYLPESQYYAI